MGLTIANLANDLFDHILGVDGGDNIGGSRVIQSGLISPRQLSIVLLLLTPGNACRGWIAHSGAGPGPCGPRFGH
jgi:1,4-dihydroxy-2-naphthoate octaprenyltransferase